MRQHLRLALACICGGSQLDLYPIDAIDAVKEENQDEDKGDLQTILYLGYERILGQEARENSVN